MEPQVHHMLKKRREGEIMLLQNDISKNNLEKNIGKVHEVLIEDIVGKYYVGRTKMDVPSMDGNVYIEKNAFAEVGSFVNVLIKRVLDYDMIGEIV